jgi:hypothetical protein
MLLTLKNEVLIFLIILIANAASAKTGKFEINLEPGIANYWVPEGYNENVQYPLIIGLPMAGMYGYEFRERMKPAAMEIGAILVCPDDNFWDIELLDRAYDHALNNYNIDRNRIILTGHSYGGGIILKYAFHNPEKISGVIAMAPSLYGIPLDYSNIIKFPLGMIVGSIDSFKGDVDALIETYDQYGGDFLYKIKEGVDHMDDYYTSDEFKEDWIECYNFITNISNVDDDKNSYSNMKILHDPGSEIAYIILNHISSEVIVEVFDLNGRSVKHIQNDFKYLEELKISLDLTNLRSGVYILTAKTNNAVYLNKLIISN